MLYDANEHQQSQYSSPSEPVLYTDNTFEIVFQGLFTWNKTAGSTTGNGHLRKFPSNSFRDKVPLLTQKHSPICPRFYEWRHMTHMIWVKLWFNPFFAQKTNTDSINNCHDWKNHFSDQLLGVAWKSVVLRNSPCSSWSCLRLSFCCNINTFQW